MRAALISSICLLFSAPAAVLAAEPPPHVSVRLAYDRGTGIEGCPDERGFRYALMAQFGYDPTEPPLIGDFEAPPLLRVTISRQGRQMRAKASLTRTSGAVIWGDQYQDQMDCPSLVQNIVLMIRIGIGVEAPFSAPPPPVLPPSPAPPPVLPTVVEPPPLRPSSRPRIRVGLGTGIYFGVAPAPAVGFSMQLGVRWPVFSLSLEGRGDLPATSEALGLTTSMFAGTLLPCGHFFKIAVACGLLTLGSRRASLLGESSHESALYAGAGGRLGIEVPFASDRLVARLSGDLVGTVQPSVVRVGVARAERWTTPAVSGGPGLGLLLNF